MNPFNIVFCSDKNYIEHLYVSLFSLLNSNPYQHFKIFIFNNGFKLNDWKKIYRLEKKFQISIKDIKIDDNVFEKLSINHHFTKANYYRLLIPELIDEDKLMYLDSDLIVIGDISELYNINLGDYFLGAVEDFGFNRHKDLKMDINSKYFNSGVMLINNLKWKKEKLSSNVTSFVKNNPNVIRFADQCGLNAIINGRWKQLDLKFNLQSAVFENNLKPQDNPFSSEEIQNAILKPTIIHFSSSIKPWNLSCKHPMKNEYWKHQIKSPFIIKTFKNILINKMKK